MLYLLYHSKEMSCPIQSGCSDLSSNCDCTGYYYGLDCVPGFGGSGDVSTYIFAQIEAGDKFDLPVIFMPNSLVECLEIRHVTGSPIKPPLRALFMYAYLDS